MACVPTEAGIVSILPLHAARLQSQVSVIRLFSLRQRGAVMTVPSDRISRRRRPRCVSCFPSAPLTNDKAPGFFMRLQFVDLHRTSIMRDPTDMALARHSTFRNLRLNSRNSQAVAAEFLLRIRGR